MSAQAMIGPTPNSSVSDVPDARRPHGDLDASMRRLELGVEAMDILQQLDRKVVTGLLHGGGRLEPSARDVLNIPPSLASD
jgi:hypothetical protein